MLDHQQVRGVQRTNSDPCDFADQRDFARIQNTAIGGGGIHRRIDVGRGLLVGDDITTLGNTVTVTGGGINTVNLNAANGVADNVNFYGAGTGVIAAVNRSTITGFNVSHDVIGLDADQTTNAATVASGNNATITTFTSAGARAFVAATDVLEFNFDFATIGDISTDLTGAALLAGAGMTSITMAANADSGYTIGGIWHPSRKADLHNLNQ